MRTTFQTLANVTAIYFPSCGQREIAHITKTKCVSLNYLARSKVSTFLYIFSNINCCPSYNNKTLREMMMDHTAIQNAVSRIEGHARFFVAVESEK